MQGTMVWMDLEMTGLDPERSVIVEIATLVTDDDLHVIAEGPVLAINHPPEALETMEEWSRNQHQASGLMDRVLASEIDTASAQAATLDFLEKHCLPKQCPLCGNSVWQDRRFLVKYMPDLNEFLHHRLIDVSTLKELFHRWYPQVKPYQKRHTHTALSDIRESLNELEFYRENLFRKNIVL